uniref:Uncharacterized protein n=1 Tax=Salmo trutta TaxID=8032 RepID=A0A673ZPE1_SALTR
MNIDMRTLNKFTLVSMNMEVTLVGSVITELLQCRYNVCKCVLCVCKCFVCVCVCMCEVVDPELDSDTSSRLADNLNHLMSTMENTTTSTRKPHRDEEDQLSEEAARVICGLADLSFMKAKVLMFPITLTPAAGSGTLLE